MKTLQNLIEIAANNTFITLVIVAIVCDIVFGVLRAIKFKCFNSSVGIDGAIRKCGMLASIIFMVLVDYMLQINLISFVPETIRTYIKLEQVGITEFFALLYLSYEVVSILKNMSLCGLPVRNVWNKVRKMLGKYTSELPDTDGLEGKTYDIK